MTEAKQPPNLSHRYNEKHCLHFCGSGIGEQLTGWPWLWVSREVAVKRGARAASSGGWGGAGGAASRLTHMAVSKILTAGASLQGCDDNMVAGLPQHVT